MKKVLRTASALILMLVLCVAVTACKDEKTLEGLKNEYGIAVDGGGFKEGSALVGKVIDPAGEEGKTALEAIKDQEYDKDGKVYIFDISVEADGVKVQPSGKVKVTVPVSEDLSGYGVWHIKGDHTVEKLSATYADGKVSFETDSFSVFIFARSKEKPSESPSEAPSESPADGSMTEAEWNAAIAYWKAQTNVKVFERTVTSQSYDPDYGSMGADIRIYQLAGTAYSSDGYFEDDVSSQNYKGKMTYLVKVGDKYYSYTWEDGDWDEDNHEYVNGFWIKNDYSAKENYESEVSSTIYTFRDSSGDPIGFSYASFTFDAETKSYKNSDGSLAIAFTFDGNKALTKIVVTETRVYEDMDFSSTSVSTVTFGDAVVDVPTDAKCSFSTAVTAFTTTEETSGVGGYITENGEQVSYNYTYLDDGTTLTLTAVADEGYVFKHWAKNVWNIDSRGYVWVTYSTDATYTVTVDGEDGKLYAVFEKVEADL